MQRLLPEIEVAQGFVPVHAVVAEACEAGDQEGRGEDDSNR
jgi:hypothetical protein